MKQWKESLLTTLAAPTVAQTTAKTKAVFNWAKEQKWITASPLEGVGTGSFVNKSGDQFVTMGEYRRLLDACPCRDWRVILALSRIGGLRCPSEVFALRWSDVNWEKGRFYVRSSKTEHHAGKEGRQVPIFPELKTELEALFVRSKNKDKEFVVNLYRDSQRPNLAKPFAQIVKDAEIEPLANAAGPPALPGPEAPVPIMATGTPGDPHSPGRNEKPSLRNPARSSGSFNCFK